MHAIRKQDGRMPMPGRPRGSILERLVTSLALLAVPLGVAAYDLDRHLWQDRLLIVAASDANDPGVIRQRHVVAERADAIADRELRVFELFSGSGTVDGRLLSPADAARLRQAFGIADYERVLLLIGKDGGIKARAPIDADLRAFFVQIDGMPMRQAEIRAKRAAGQQVTQP